MPFMGWLADMKGLDRQSAGTRQSVGTRHRTHAAYLQLFGGLLLLTPLWSEASLLDRIGCGDLNSINHSYVLSASQQALAAGALNILVVGSSSTAGTGARSANGGYVQRTEALLKDPRIFVTARGKGGETARGALARLDDEIEHHDPDLVVWQVGTNDALRRLNLDDVRDTINQGIALIQQHGADVILIDPQYFPKSDRNPHYRAIVDMMAKLGTDQSVAVVQRYARMQLAGSEIDDLLATDKLHMSDAGHSCLARDLAQTVNRGVDSRR